MSCTNPSLQRFLISCFACIALITAIGFFSVGAGVMAADVWPLENDGDFTVILMPDTQNYTYNYPHIYIAQTEWIKYQRDAMNIRFVIHLGDIVQSNLTNTVEDDLSPAVEREWQLADRAHRVLDGVVPYSVTPGNHDMDGQLVPVTHDIANRDTTLYNKYFPPKRFEKYKWYGGHQGDKNNNNYCIFKASGMKFLVLSLEYSPNLETMKWGNKVLADHPDCRAIVATHGYLKLNGRYHIGDKIWENTIRKNKNVFLVVCGHVPGVKLTEDTTDAGTKVTEMLVDYQCEPNGGDGWLRILRFSPNKNKIFVRDYSPTLGKFQQGPDCNFSFDYKMPAGADD